MTRNGCMPDTERLTDRIMARLARSTQWSPIGARVTIIVDDSDDPSLVDLRLFGIVRGWSTADDGTPRDLLVELDQDIDYQGLVPRCDIHWLVTRPCLRWRRTSRLIFGWSAARIIDAPSFRDATYDRTIGTGRLRLL